MEEVENAINFYHQYLSEFELKFHQTFRIVSLSSTKMILNIKDDPILQVSGQEPLVSPRHHVALCGVLAKKVVPYQHLSKYWIYQTNEVRSSQNFQHMSKLVSSVD